jgi:urease accessory protein
MRKQVDMKGRAIGIAAGLVLMGAAGTVGAHPGLQVGGIAAAFSHPFAGLDHLLAMFAVGAWAACGGGRYAPLGFLAGALAGAALGALGLALPALETGLALSVLCCGLALAAARAWPALVALFVCAGCGTWHGNAHGLEIPGLLAAAPLAAFAAGTALLHVAGYITAISLRRRAPALLRGSGWALALCGGLLALA